MKLLPEPRYSAKSKAQCIFGRTDSGPSACTWVARWRCKDTTSLAAASPRDMRPRFAAMITAMQSSPCKTQLRSSRMRGSSGTFTTTQYRNIP